MPLYEYHCESCEQDFEKRRSLQQADAPIECPECESDNVTRKLSLFIALGKRDAGPRESGGGCCGGTCGCSSHAMN